MRSITLHLLVALLTFAIAIAIIRLTNVYPRIETFLVNLVNTPDLDKMQVKPDGSFVEDDPFSSDFEPSCACKDFPSSKGANRAFREEMKIYQRHRYYGFGSKILKREPRWDAEGKRIGERVVAVYCCGMEGQQAAHILWTDGSRFCDIIAPTVQQALDFEKARNQ